MRTRKVEKLPPLAIVKPDIAPAGCASGYAVASWRPPPLLVAMTWRAAEKKWLVRAVANELVNAGT